MSVADLSIILLYSAMAVYACAFLAYTLDLARRSATASAPQRERVSAGFSTAESERLRPTFDDSDAGAAPSSPPKVDSAAARVAVMLTVFGWLLHAGATVLRGVAAERVPWANMFEFSLTGTLVIIGVFLLAQIRFDLRFLGTFVVGLMLILLGVGTVNFYVDVIPLVPALQSAWLVIHVFVAMLATAFFALSFATSALQLVQARREQKVAEAERVVARVMRSIPESLALDTMSYRMNVVGFILWTFTLMAGAIWAERAWGRYWGWDVKEVWTFIIWVIYAAYIHAKATRGWSGSPAAWLSIIGFIAVLFNFGIVNVFFTGLHAYSGL